MKALSVALGAVAVLGLSGCASTHAARMDSASTASPTPEQVYIATVEQVAARRGLDVIWVNPPKPRPERMVASR